MDRKKVYGKNFSLHKDGKRIWYVDEKKIAVFEFDGIRDSAADDFGTSVQQICIAPRISHKAMHHGKRADVDGFLGSESTLMACL